MVHSDAVPLRWVLIWNQTRLPILIPKYRHSGVLWRFHGAGIISLGVGAFALLLWWWLHDRLTAPPSWQCHYARRLPNDDLLIRPNDTVPIIEWAVTTSNTNSGGVLLVHFVKWRWCQNYRLFSFSEGGGHICVDEMTPETASENACTGGGKANDTVKAAFFRDAAHYGVLAWCVWRHLAWLVVVDDWPDHYSVTVTFNGN